MPIGVQLSARIGHDRTLMKSPQYEAAYPFAQIWGSPPAPRPLAGHVPCSVFPSSARADR